LSAGTESSVEVLERLLEPNLGWIEFPHRGREAVLGEVIRVDAARGGDQLHRPHRRFVVPIGEHVDVGVGDPPAVELAGRLGQPPVCKRSRIHQRSQRLSEWSGAWASHRVL
jgi:hypothetical protein